MRRFLLGLAVVLMVAGLPFVAIAAGIGDDPCLGAETIMGTEGDDVLIGTAGDDVISGLGGNDSIDGRGGDDYICGGPGADTVHGGDGNDFLRGGGGRDSLYGEGGFDAMFGGSGVDRLWGGPQGDFMRGGKGKDRMWGGGGIDTLLGRSGSDRLWGGSSDDVLNGGRDDDSLSGWRGDDVLYGRQGNDRISGGTGADQLFGGPGEDTLVPGIGNDSCHDDGDVVVCPSPYRGDVVIADDQEPPTLNPYGRGGDIGVLATIGQALHAGVFDIDGATGELIPELVTELPTVANGGVTVNQDGSMTVRYSIRDEAVWSDGVPVSGDDFEFTLEKILDPDLLRVDTRTYEDIVSTSFSDKTFQFTLPEQTARYELLFDIIIPKHAVEGSDFLADWNDTIWPSAGPFVLAEWKKGKYLSLVRNENYWKSDSPAEARLPYLDSVTFAFIPSYDDIVAAFESRQVDVVTPGHDVASIKRLQLAEEQGADVQVEGGPIWEHFNFQFGPGRLTRNPESANDNLNFRKGVAHAIDRQLLADEVYDGLVDPIDSYVEAYSPTLSQGAWAQYDYNPATAVGFFDAAKAEMAVDELSVVFSTTSNNDARVQLASLLEPMFAAVEVGYRAELEDAQIFFGPTFDDGTWDFGEFAYGGRPGLWGLVDAMDLWDPEGEPPQGSNYYRWGTPDSSVVDSATARFAVIRDDAAALVLQPELTHLINEAEQILADNVVLIPLYQRPTAGAVWADEIVGYSFQATGSGHTWNIEYWDRADR